MKLAAQIFIVIGMVLGFWTILPLVFGIMALVQMKDGKPATWLNVCVLIFCSLIGDILLLVSKEEDYM